MTLRHAPRPSRRLVHNRLALLLMGMVLVPASSALWAGDIFFRGFADVTDRPGKIDEIQCSKDISCGDLHIGHWDRATCKANIISRLNLDSNFSNYYNNKEYFHLQDDGKLANGSNMTLTLLGCNELCGGWTWYWDAGPRLTTWVIPVVLLLSNIELTPIDKRRFMTVAHAVGDPIDSFWSILHKIYVWRRLYDIGLSKCIASNGTGVVFWIGIWKQVRTWTSRRRRRAGLSRLGRSDSSDVVGDNSAGDGDGEGAGGDYDTPHDRARVIATVLAGFEEIGGAQTTSELHYHMLLKRLGEIGNTGHQSPGAWKEWRRCARELADARTNEIPRTLLAIFIYVFGVVAALYDDIGGGNTSKPGGRIGSAMFLMWLVPLALLSNTVGTFPSRRTCIAIMRVFVGRAKDAMRMERALEQEREHQQARDRTRQRTGSGSRASDASLGAPFMSLGSPALSPNIKSPAGPSSPLIVQSTPSVPESPPTARHGGGRARNSSHPSPATVSSYFRGHTHTAHARHPSPEAQRRRTRSSETRAPATPEITISESQGQARTETSRSPGRGGKGGPRWPAQTPPARHESVEMYPSPNHSQSPSRRRHSPGEIGPLTSDLGDRHRADSIDIFPESGQRRRTSSSAPLLNSPEFAAMRWLTGSDSAIIDELSSSQGARPHEPGGGHAESAISNTADQVHIIPSGSWDVYFSWLQPLGGIYTYRPWKMNYRSVSVKSHVFFTSNWLLYCFSLFPVAISAVGAFMIMWYAVPEGWSCRHVWVVTVSAAWLLNTAITVSVYKWKPFGLEGRGLWVLVVIKDGIVGVGGLALVFFSTAGLFNSCYCWSAYMWHSLLPGDGGKKAYVPLNASDTYDRYAQEIYSRIVFGCLGAQFVFFFFIVFLWWDGLYVVRWSEDRCRREWRYEIGGGENKIPYDDETKLLFWYSESELKEEDDDLRERRRTFTIDENSRRKSRTSVAESIRNALR